MPVSTTSTKLQTKWHQFPDLMLQNNSNQRFLFLHPALFIWKRSEHSLAGSECPPRSAKLQNSWLMSFNCSPCFSKGPRAASLSLTHTHFLQKHCFSPSDASARTPRCFHSRAQTCIPTELSLFGMYCKHSQCQYGPEGQKAVMNCG